MNLFNNQCLIGKFILVTGASSGIGKAVAIELAKCGARVLITGRDEKRLSETLASLSGSGHVMSLYTFSTADDTAAWLKAQVTLHGVLSGVFHSSGMEQLKPVKLIKQGHLDEIFGTNVYSSFGLAKAIAQKNILEDGGSILFMSSVAAMRGQTGMTAYAASKGAIEGLVKSLAVELSPRLIRVNAIAAGAVKTELHERVLSMSTPQAIEEYERKHLLGFGEVQDVAQLSVFMLSDAGRWFTGSTVVIDGGYTVR